MIKKQIKYQNNNINIFFLNDFIYQHSGDTFFEIEMLEKLISNNINFKNSIDIGANVGNHTNFFYNIGKAENVYSFEPIKENFEVLLKNNPNKKNCYNLALSNYNGFGIMNNNSSYNSGTSKLIYEVDNDENEIQCITLDTLNLKDITFIKIDVEGHELFVLEGSKNTILKFKPDILIEIHDDVTIENVLDYLPKNYKIIEKIGHYNFILKYNENNL